MSASSPLTAFSQSSTAQPTAPWRVVGLPERYAKPVSQFDIVDLDGSKVLRVRTLSSWGSLVHPYLGQANIINFQWRLDTPLPLANLRVKETEDAPLKVCASFDMPVANMPLAERNLFRLVQFFTSNKLPTATLCYVWANSERTDSLITSPVTGRVRYLVLDSGGSPLGRWQSHQRNLHADFLLAFGAESSAIPPLSAIAVSADSDNTRGTSLGYVRDIALGF